MTGNLANLKTILVKSIKSKSEKLDIRPNFKVKDLGKDMVSFSKDDMKTINASKGDLVYIQDSRWWLGGLKSIHATFDDPHDENGVVYMSEVQRDSGMFIDNLPLKAEKEM